VTKGVKCISKVVYSFARLSILIKFVFVQPELIFKMPTIASLKGVRTMYRKVVIIELQKANDIMKSELSAVSEIGVLKDVPKC
jgi:hypothetical protein